MPSIGEDIAVIKNEIKNISTNFSRLEQTNREWNKKVNDLENKQIELKTKLSNMSVFQATLSIITSAIAAYLGVKK